MSRQRTTRSIYRHDPTAASQNNNGMSAAGDGGFNFIPHTIKATIRAKPKALPTRTEKARWLSSTRRKYPQFSWGYFAPPEELIRHLQASDCHTNACTHFKKQFNTISKQFGWKWSREDVLSAWRHTPEDLKAAWNGIFQVNDRPAKASGGKRERIQMTNPTSTRSLYEPIQMSLPSTSNLELSGLRETVPAFSNSRNSLPIYFGSPLLCFDVIEAKWHDFYEKYPPAPQVGAEVPIYVPPPLSQEWTPLPPSSVYPHPSGYSSPASAASSPLTFAGPSYFAASLNNSHGSYLSPSEYHHEYPEPSQAAPRNDFGHQIDLDLSLQPLNGSFPEAPLVGPDTDGSSFLPDLGRAFESHYIYTQRQYNSFGDHPEGSAQIGSGVEDLFASRNGPVEPDFAFDARRADPAPNFSSPNAYELLAMGINLWGPA